MRNVAIVGAGQSKFGSFPTSSIKELFASAYQDLLKSVDKGLDPSVVDAAWVGTMAVGGFQLGQSGSMLLGHVGLAGIPVARVENACASGGYALLQAIHAIKAGACDVALVIGVEKMTDLSTMHAKYWLGVSGDTEYERLAGMTFAGIFAMAAQRYLHDYGYDRRVLSEVAVKNHAHGALNPKAQMQKKITLEEAMAGINVASPLNLYDCSLISDGAACLLLTTEERAGEFTDNPVYLRGWGAASDFIALHERQSITSLSATQKAAQQAYQRAGVGPQDIHVAEVHDCFTIAELMAYEDLGFCGRGQAPKLLASGATALGGRMPVNPDGGLKSKGHPLGATGVSQVGELFHQLRGQADRRQVQGARLGLSHNIGGSGASAAVFILEGRA